MTDTAVPAPTSAPPLLVTLIHDYAQKALTMGAVALAAHGVIAASQEDQAVQLGVSGALFIFSVGWTYVAARFRTGQLKAAIAAPAVTPPTAQG
ncbi:MAG: hypothetical protein M3T55_05840 [Pseudomonadota bacterium]|nr:hypothetical protein [Pseudomonadota bacterium]